jgi:molecular chaperone GrpE
MGEDMKQEQNAQEDVATEDMPTDEQTQQSEVEETSEPTCEEKLNELNDKYLRLNAEFENYRKRMEKEKYQAMSYAHESFSGDLLPVLDALENALSASDEESMANVESMKKGIELTVDKLTKIFEKHGIETIALEGEFDPNLHNAIMQAESEDHESGQIVQTLQKGYKIKERILRPAMVQVAK